MGRVVKFGLWVAALLGWGLVVAAVMATSPSSAKASCDIGGPTNVAAGEAFTLCGPVGAYSYEWRGPGIPSGEQRRCVTIEGQDIGSLQYELLTRDGRSRRDRCVHVVSVSRESSNPNECLISGPAVVVRGSTIQLCAPRRSNVSYRWSGPNGFGGNSSCADIDAPGDYVLTIRSLATGEIERCVQHVEWFVGEDNGGNDPDFDAPITENCPRPLNFWRAECSRGGGRGRELSDTEVRQIASAVDQHSGYFNWNDDLQGWCGTLRPARPMTARKQVAEHFASLLANVAAGEIGVTTSDGSSVSLDVDTRISFRGARTVGQLITMVDRLLSARRGDYRGVAGYLYSINSGKGIGPVCE